MHELIGTDVPEETKATCADCVMCAPQETRNPAAITFDASTKCCTYTPSIPNFLVGRILAPNDDPIAQHGRRTLLERLGGPDANPISVDCPRDRSVLYMHRAEDAFGRSSLLRCPHYAEREGACGVWQNRTANCATWYCKHTRGALGQRGWSVMRRLLQEVESQLSLWCAMGLGFRASALWPLASSDPTDSPNPVLGAPFRFPPDWRSGWGEWEGREAEFYLRCAAAVEPLNWTRVREICGWTTTVLEELTRELFAPMVTPTPVPPGLIMSSFEAVKVSQHTMQIVTYSDYDPVEVPLELLPLLGQFDGRPTDEVLARFQAATGNEVSGEFLRMLVDFDILVPSAPQLICR